MIATESIQQVNDTTRIEEVVADFITIKRSGANYIARCPFHDEKTPSFIISPVKGIYKCFSCGESGNSIKFLMKHDNLSFVDAVKYIAKRYNIKIIETELSSEQKESLSTREKLLTFNDLATNYFIENLNNTSEGKEIGFSYFKERGLTNDIINSFKLGYAIDNSKDFLNYLNKNSLDIDTAIQLGLLKQNENKDNWDFFKNRVIFPIQNITGRIVGFAGRTLKEDKNIPKYINSQESEVYNKSKILYGLFQAKNTISKLNSCILVEGYLDVISLHLADIKNVVASSGTALTKEQTIAIRRLTENITILYDGDQAGIKAATRGLSIAIENDLNVKICNLPDNHDPDSFVRKYGGNELLSFLEKNSVDFIAFIAKSYKVESLNEPLKKTQFVKELINIIALIKDRLKRTFYIKECAVLMDIDEAILVKEIQIKLNVDLSKKYNNQVEENPFTLNSELTDIIIEDNSSFESRYISIKKKLEFDLCRILIERGDKIYEDSDNPFDLDNNKLVWQEIFLNTKDISFESTIAQKTFNILIDDFSKGIFKPIKYYANYENIEIADFVCSICYELNKEELANWKMDDNKKIIDYGENYKKELDDIIYRLEILNIDKFSKEILQIAKNLVSTDEDYFEENKKIIAIQMEFLNETISRRNKINFQFRNIN